MPIAAVVPLALGIASVVTSLIGTGVSVAGSVAQGNAEKDQAGRNAKLAREAAADIVRRGLYESGLYRAKGTRDIARQAVAAGASGVDASGSVEGMAADTRYWAELDAMTTHNNALREAWGLEMHGLDYLQAGDAARRRADYSAAGNLLTGVSNASSSLYSLTK